MSAWHGPAGPALPFAPVSLRENLLTVTQVAKRLGMSQQWVRDHIERRSPRIPCVWLRSSIRFRPFDIDLFIDQQAIAPVRRRA
jgi:predicted DNA-binding transcriptional regulator AlpA